MSYLNKKVSSGDIYSRHRAITLSDFPPISQNERVGVKSLKHGCLTLECNSLATQLFV